MGNGAKQGWARQNLRRLNVVLIPMYRGRFSMIQVEGFKDPSGRFQRSKWKVLHMILQDTPSYLHTPNPMLSYVLARSEDPSGRFSKMIQVEGFQVFKIQRSKWKVFMFWREAKIQVERACQNLSRLNSNSYVHILFNSTQ